MGMSGDRFDQNPQSAPVLQLLVELPSWPQVFFDNLRDLVFPRRLPPLELRSAPAPFWPDVLVKRRLPWNRFLESALCHLIAIELVIAATHFFALQPHAMPRPSFDHAQIVYSQPSEYLPPIDTRSAHAPKPVKADPELSRQPIISLPAEPDNRSQTIVAPPNIKLKHDVALPNIVAWSDKVEKPRLAIPPVPLTPAAEITRIAPQLETSVVAPAPDASRLTHRRDSPNLQTAVVAPPPDLRASRTAVLDAPEPAVIAPPPSVQNTARRGDINIGRSSVIAPAPQLAVSEQRAVAGGRSRGAAGAMQVVAPPPSLSASGPSGQSFGSRGRTIALNLHPTVGAPPDPPAGNRRGAFAATPDGHAGASGSPGAAGHDGSRENGNGSSRKGTGDLPAGLYVGAAAKPSPVAGDPAKGASTTSVSPNLIASVRPPRATSERPMQPADASKLTEQERVVFGNRKFYSLTLNMPNLNSAGGSWVIRFAEMKQDPKAPAADISQPVATRKVDPAYPTQLMHENVSGTVILYAVIHADGTVGGVRVLRGVDARLDQFAGQALTQWRFEPATKNGAPVDVEATFHIPFHPSHQGF